MKQQLRQQIRVARQGLTPQEKAFKSMQIQQRVFPLLKDESHVFLYQACPQEVQTTWLFEHLKQHVFAPMTKPDAHMTWLRIHEDTIWEKGCFSIFEPSNGEQWNPSQSPITIICPLLAFDRQGHRLGQGMGCYDRWLSRYGMHVKQIIAFAFSCQELPSIPHETHDYPINAIITEHEKIKVKP
ncbi:MAG: 5-formyltetrahydrofolate cyclo-ligase [Mariprofundaceae bacterium]|nr:5-formyltetrahydrofolate cyclo-ligase [Mariprofundaceae bacterium]